MCDSIDTSRAPERLWAFKTTPFNTTTSYTKVTACTDEPACTVDQERRYIHRVRRCDDGRVMLTAEDRCFPVCKTRQCDYSKFFYWDQNFMAHIDAETRDFLNGPVLNG